MNKELKRKYRYGTRRQKSLIHKCYRQGYHSSDDILFMLRIGIGRPVKWRQKVVW